MAKGIEIDIAANTRDFQKGTKNVEEALDDVADALDDVSKDADKAGKNLGNELEDGARDAEKSVEKLERSFKEVADASKRETRKAGEAMKSNTKDATTTAARDMGELKDEAVQNASETFSSFDGSIDSFVDGIQGTFGGIVSNMGPIGAAIGGALAIGIGTAVAKGEEVAAAITEAKERAAQLAQEIDEVDGNLSAITWADKVKEWGLAIEDSREWFEFWQEDARTAFEVASDAADQFNLSAKDLALGLSGVDADRAAASIKELGEQVEDLEDKRRKADKQTDREAIKSEIRQREDLIGKLEKQGNVTEEAIELNKLSAEVTKELAAADEAAAAAIEARTDATQSLQKEVDESVSGWSEYVNAETGAIDPGAYIAAIQARIDATSNFNTNVQSISEKFGFTMEETQALLDQGVDFAPMLQDIVDSGFEGQFAETFKNAVGAGQSIIDGTPVTATVDATADTDKATAELDEAAEDRTADVKAEASTKAAAKALDNLAAKKRTATISASVNLSSAEAALTRFINQRRTATITVEARDREGKLVP